MTQAHYDAFAEDFSRTRTHRRPWPEIELLRPHVKKSDKVLDLGCGNGRLREYFGASHLALGNYYGFDLSEKLLDDARTRFPQDHFFKGSFTERFPFGDDTFEVVTGLASFHHILNKKEQIHFMAECTRVMKPGGILFLTTWKLPDKYRWSNLLGGRWRNWHIPYGKEKKLRIYRRVSARGMARIAKKAGFTILKTDLMIDERNPKVLRNYVLITQKKTP